MRALWARLSPRRAGVGANPVRSLGRRLGVSIQVINVVQIYRPPKEGIVRTRRREELLEFPHVIQLQISNGRLDAQAFAQLNESWLAIHAGCRRIGIESLNRRRGLAVLASDINKTSVDLSQQRQIQVADRRPFEQWLNHAAPDNRLVHPEQRFSGKRRIRDAVWARFPAKDLQID